jgi:hypothetical protein
MPRPPYPRRKIQQYALNRRLGFSLEVMKKRKILALPRIDPWIAQYVT